MDHHQSSFEVLIQEQLNFDVNKINEQVSFNKLKMMFIIEGIIDRNNKIWRTKARLQNT